MKSPVLRAGEGVFLSRGHDDAASHTTDKIPQGRTAPHTYSCARTGRGSRFRFTREQGFYAEAILISDQNVKVVREAFLAYGGGDPAAAQVTRERFFHPSIEWDMSGVVGWVEKRVYRGQEVGEFLQAWADSWRTWHFDLEEVRDAGGEQVFAAIHEWGIGVDSGASVDQRRYFAIKLCGGRMAYVQMFSDSGEALEAVGLSE